MFVKGVCKLEKVIIKDKTDQQQYPKQVSDKENALSCNQQIRMKRKRKGFAAKPTYLK